MRLLLLPEKKELIKGRERVIQKQRVFFVSDINQDFHTEYGVIVKSDLTKTGSIKTSQGKKLCNIPASFVDIWKRMARGPQVPLLKDVGLVVAETGMSADSVVVDAGGGSGGMACYFAHIAGAVSTYEVREDHVAIIKENVKKLGVDVVVHHKDVCEGIEEKEVDIIFLDMPTPWDAVGVAKDSLKAGGFLIGYLPTTVQMSRFIESLNGFLVTKKVEVVERPWKVEGDAVRPVSKGVQHSGFLVFARKL